MEGFVKWFSSEDGYGYITPYDGGPDVFVHASAIQMSGYKHFVGGEHVSFDRQQGTYGPQASKVEILGAYDPDVPTREAELAAALDHTSLNPPSDQALRARRVGIPALLVVMVTAYLLALAVAGWWVWIGITAMAALLVLWTLS